MSAAHMPVLSEKVPGDRILVKQAVLLVLGVLALAVSAKVQVAMWPSPVPITLGTFAVLSIGAAYGPRLGLATILAYMLIGSLGFDVFANSSAELNGISYMMGSTGGYLLGYVLATLALGFAARKAWDRNVFTMVGAMLVGNALIYVPGLLWLSTWIETTGRLDLAKYSSLADQTLVWGLTPYVIGDGMKLALAALLFPLLWSLVGKARG
ncbi:MAG: biotin transporter BioY [Pseudomonadota bacterium]